MVKGTFITVEGPDGAGKTTVLNIIAEELAAEGYPIVQTREPGGSPIAEKIRQIILDKNIRKWTRGQRRYFMLLQGDNI